MNQKISFKIGVDQKNKQEEKEEPGQLEDVENAGETSVEEEEKEQVGLSKWIMNWTSIAVRNNNLFPFLKIKTRQFSGLVYSFLL